MVKKDKWLTYPDVARTAEKLILNGIPEEKINGSMVWDELGYGSRHSAYRFLADWRAQRKVKSKLTPFAMSDEMRDRFVTTVADLMGDALQAERQALAKMAEASDVRIATQDDEIAALMTSLEITEQERDQAVVQVDEMAATNKDLVTALAASEASVEALRKEYDRLFDRVHASKEEGPAGPTAPE